MLYPMSCHHIWNAPDQTVLQNVFGVYVHSSVDTQQVNQTSRISDLEHISMVLDKWM